MRKSTKVTFLTLLLCCIALCMGIFATACEKKVEEEPAPITYTVVYNSNGGAKVKDGSYTVGEVFNLPTPSVGADPLMYGYSFVGWFYDEACTKEVKSREIDVSYATAENTLVFYAKWTNIHSIYFDTKTTELIDPVQYAYGTEVAVADLPKASARMVGEVACEFVCWVQANTGEQVVSDFTMDAVDMYFYAIYDTGVNYRFELDEDGNYIPLGTNSVTQQTKFHDYTLQDGEVYTVGMTFPADWSEYTDDSGPVFTGTQFNDEGTTFNDGYYIAMFVSAPTKLNGAIEFWGSKDNAEGETSAAGSLVLLARYTLDGSLKGTPYAEKMKAYQASGEEETFIFTYRRVDTTVGEGDSATTKVTYYIGIDGNEYFKLTTGEKPQADETQLGATDVISTKLTGTLVGMRAKTKGVKFNNFKLATADKATITLEVGNGTVEGSTSLSVSYGEAVTIPTPTQSGYEFYAWNYTNYLTGELISWTNGTVINKDMYNICLIAEWRKLGAQPYTIKLDTGVDGYVVEDVTGWYEGNILRAPTLAYSMRVYTGEWFYNAARTQKADLQALDPQLATITDAETENQAFTLYAGVERREFTGIQGEGTETSPYLLSSVGDFATFASFVTEGETFAGSYLQVTADVTLGDWTPLSKFSGVFDGNNKTITATINSSNVGKVGLFSTLDKATVKNVVLNVNVTGLGSVGGLAGVATGSTVIENCTVSGSITATKDAGGIVGSTSNNVTVKDCTNYATVTTSVTDVTTAGGIVGATTGKIEISGCKNYGVITGAGRYVGGIVGLVRADANSIVKDCENHANVSGAKSVGSIVGTARSKVQNCYTLETVTVNSTALTELSASGSSGNSYVGSIIGEIMATSPNYGAMESCGTMDASGTKTTLS